ncbi:NAD-dependent epimerase/dehydratase family protein [Fictibacillus sp. FJAT-27399]|uniref:NAD-dependent epimerase/dehydratase family protein n=1 Tax=Fictibacillus sp. FJAT-27399 TaxID=1729689 RepID=UPI0007816FA8|nr:NAD-dependent epimerase/dehydratase family protein [Fictibacillus sp. FJAT-27399]
MRILIIGGTRFVGRYITASFLQKGHQVTLFNRGSNQELFPECQTLIGDRDSDLKPLRGQKWDAVVDTCGYFPRQTEQMAKTLRDSVPHYTYISSVSAYKSMEKKNQTEESELGVLTDTATEEITGETYGPLKAACEEKIKQTYGESCLIIRPGLIVGPHDYSDRFTYWPARAAKGGGILAPAEPDRQVQFIDVRDLSEWIVSMVEKKAAGVFNAVGDHYRMAEVLKACLSVTKSGGEIIWVEESFLNEKKVDEWMELPLWISSKKSLGIQHINNDKAIASGLAFRNIQETIMDTFNWDQTRNMKPEDYKAGMSPDREKELLSEWRAKTVSHS